MRKRVAVAYAVAMGAMVGSMMLSSGCAVFGAKEAEETDVVISMNDLPPAVKPLAEKEVAGCRIIEVEKENKDGKVIYAITYDQAGVEMEIEYAEDGTLLSKGKE